MVWPVIGRLLGGLAFGAAAEGATRPGFWDRVSGAIHKLTGGMLGSKVQTPSTTTGNETAGSQSKSKAEQQQDAGQRKGRAGDRQQGGDEDQEEQGTKNKRSVVDRVLGRNRDEEEQRNGDNKEGNEAESEKGKRQNGIWAALKSLPKTALNMFTGVGGAVAAALAAAAAVAGLKGNRDKENEAIAEEDATNATAENAEVEQPAAEPVQQGAAQAQVTPTIDARDMPEVNFKDANHPIDPNQEPRLLAEGGTEAEQGAVRSNTPEVEKTKNGPSVNVG